MTARFLSRREVAELLALPERTLAALAYKGTGPRYYRVGRHARYRPEDVERWLETRAVEGTEDAG